MVTVTTTARLHFGFGNLSLAHDRLYGGVGCAIQEPRVVVDATAAPEVRCEEAIERTVRRAVTLLGVEGADVTLRGQFRRHAGLGSGTQFALAILVAVAHAHDREVDPRRLAPDVGRGGRSGVGVATFEGGGFVVDAGHPTERFTSEPPADGEWVVPAVAARHDLPEDWRFVLVVPDVGAGPSGPEEERQMRQVVERADAGIADDVAGVLTRELLPAAAEGDARRFGDAAARLGRLNGAWYADEQGGVYSPPAGRIIEALVETPAIAGAGQSSWGPTVWTLTTRGHEDDAKTAAEMALSQLGLDGDVRVTEPQNEGAAVGQAAIEST
jgi:beta-ribofuranosylaminobenzene 5'-phosphate synthase